MTPHEIADHRTDLLTFSQTMFRARKGADLVPAPHHKPICDALERVVIGKTRRLIINIPPRSGKTELAVINFIAWCMGNFPDSEFIHATYSKRLATANAYSARALMMHEKFAEIFGPSVLSGDSKAKDEFRTDQGGLVYATGADGSITGVGAGKMREAFGGCFPYNEMIQTESGPVAIGDIVTSGKPVRVWSYNEATGAAELKKIKATFVNPANHIIEISSKDGRKLRCTPDHEVLTQAGWVSAIHFAKALNLVDGQPGNSCGVLSGKAPISGDAYDFVRMFWFSVPLGIRQMLCDACPGLSELDLANNAIADPVHFGEFGCAEVALEYFQNFFSCEFGARSPLQQGECSVADSVLHVVALCAIRKICEAIVERVPVEMSNFIPVGALTYEMLSNEVRDILSGDYATNGKIDAKIPIAIKRRLQKSNGLCPSDLTACRDFIQPIGPGDWRPDRVGYIGFHNATYCIEVEDNNNFILSQSGAVVSNCIIIDDPHKAGEANSPVMRQNVIDWFSTTMESRKNNPNTPIIVIMQRLHENDLAGWLLGGGNGEEWEHLCIPALSPSGESFWPQQFPLDMLNRLRDANSYVFAGQYLQQPAPLGGGIFKAEWLRHWAVLPDLEYRMIYADTAMKTGQENDFSVFQHWGKGKDGKIYLLDMIRGKWEAPQLLAQARAFWDKCRNQHGGTLRKMKVEDKASGTGLIQQLRQGGIPVEGIQRDRDKVTRGYDSAPQVEAGNVMLPERHDCLSDLLHELTLFPVATHDDCADPLMDAVQDMLNAKKPLDRPIPVKFAL